MGADPRLNMLATPVIQPGASEADRALAALGAMLATQGKMIADLQREIRDLRSAATIQVTTVTPTGAARDGTPVVDSGTIRLYLRVNGVWRFTALT